MLRTSKLDYEGLVDQLMDEGFTEAEASHGADLSSVRLDAEVVTTTATTAEATEPVSTTAEATEPVSTTEDKH